MEAARLRLEPSRIDGQQLTLAAQLDHSEFGRHRLWWRLPAAWAESVTAWADPFVVGFLFAMMQWGCDVVVEGRVSPSLLENLENFMAIWHVWRPAKYRLISIRATDEVESPTPALPRQTVIPFSCGVDSCFTLLRHRRATAGRRTRDIRAGVVMHGFDIWLDQDNATAMYEGVLASAQVLLDSQAVACIPMASNFHELPTRWLDSYGAHLVSGLRLLAGRFDAMLFPNDTMYDCLSIISGSHPVCLPLLSGRSFQVIDDGGEFLRSEKARLISDWPEAMGRLRVCFANPASHLNCCRCQKCVRTMLCFRAIGRPIPAAFSRGVTDRQIRRVRLRHDYEVKFWTDLLTEATRNNLSNASWVRAVRAAIRRGRMRMTLDRFRRPFIPLRNCIRGLFRGSTLSRRQLAEQAAAAARGSR